jgi:exodeoxyribonuclease VII large subunit
MSSVWRQPQNLVDRRGQIFNDLARRLDRSINDILQARTARLAVAAAGLDARSPSRILDRGYAIVRHQGKIIRDPDEIICGDVLNIQIRNTDIEVKVLGKGEVHGQS